MASFSISTAGDSAINLEFARTISAETSRLVRAAAQTLSEDRIPGVTELVPAFCSLMVCYDPNIIGYDSLCARVTGKLRTITGSIDSLHRIVTIPVCYGGDYGPDLQTVARHAGLSPREVIEIHSGRDYLIDMLGFLPGFAYLGGLDKRLHTPRLASPRTVIPAGSVGIGGAQTGIYPLASPGGWQLIGRTPVMPYDPARAQPILYAAGDYIRFAPITEERYRAIQSQVDNGTYCCEITMEEN